MSEPSTELPTRAWVEVDLAALCANAATLLQGGGPAAGLLPMVKADGYGLGATRVAAALAARLPPDRLYGFGVAAVSEGESLRAAGWRGRVLVFTPLAASEYPQAARAGLTVSLSSLEAVETWASTARSIGRRLPFHLEIDTGMGRSGFPVEEVDRWSGPVARHAGADLRWEGCFTHFHSADEPDLGPTNAQWSRFVTGLERVTKSAPEGLDVHVANSAASLRCSYPARFTRPGIFLYGGRVGAEPPRRVVDVRARVVLVREVAAGTTVGYGATYRARRGGERWATVAIGYGDGIPRVLGTAGGHVLLRGRRVPMVGRISMDTLVVDVTAAPDVEMDDVATLIGADGGEEISVDEVAAQAGTISYEVLTGLTPRLPRVYRGPPDLVDARLDGAEPDRNHAGFHDTR